MCSVSPYMFALGCIISIVPIIYTTLAYVHQIDGVWLMMRDSIYIRFRIHCGKLWKKDKSCKASYKKHIFDIIHTLCCCSLILCLSFDTFWYILINAQGKPQHKAHIYIYIFKVHPSCADKSVFERRKKSLHELSVTEPYFRIINNDDDQVVFLCGSFSFSHILILCINLWETEIVCCGFFHLKWHHNFAWEIFFIREIRCSKRKDFCTSCIYVC